MSPMMTPIMSTMCQFAFPNVIRQCSNQTSPHAHVGYISQIIWRKLLPFVPVGSPPSGLALSTTSLQAVDLSSQHWTLPKTCRGEQLRHVHSLGTMASSCSICLVQEESKACFRQIDVRS